MKSYQDVVKDRDEGMKKSEEMSGEEWCAYALAFVHSYLQVRPTLFCDDLWEAGLRKPKSPRALGSVIKKASKNGWMRPLTTSGGMTLCRKSKTSNMQFKAVWHSNILKGV